MGETEELAWAAGFFDGEGSSYVHRSTGGNYPTVRLDIQQDDRFVLDRFQRAVGVGRVYGPYSRRPGMGSTRPFWKYQAGSWRDTQATIAMLWRFLSPRKREQYAQALLRVKGG